MTRWFLRLFSAFRNLEAQVADSLSARKAYAESLEHAEAKAQSLQSDLTFSRKAFEECHEEKMRLQDRLDAALDDKEHLWEMIKESQAAKDYAYQTQVNHAVQRSGGGIPYPQANALPPNVIRPLQQPGPVGRRGRVLSSQAREDHNRSFISSLTMEPHEEA